MGYVVQVANTWQVTSGTCESWANYVKCRRECDDWNEEWERFAHALEIHACAHYVASSSTGLSISISLLTFLSLYVLYHCRELFII
ncbi:hypothetical protein Ddc_11663 [Ditylenchus destructor]|nr:hypothetical protein Ddc_11663 [Ditylenchus destructor]